MAKEFVGSIAASLCAACLVLGQSAEELPTLQVTPSSGPAVGAPETAPAEESSPGRFADLAQAPEKDPTPAPDAMLPPPRPEAAAPSQAALPPQLSTLAPGEWEASGPCGPGCPDGRCGHGERFYVSGEFLLWGFSNPLAPPLVTEGPVFISNGILGNAGTEERYAGQHHPLLDVFRYGGRLTAGYWCDPHQDVAVEASVFAIGQRTDSATFGPVGSTVLARPIVSINSASEAVELVTFPGLSRGVINISYPTSLWGAEANCIKKVCCDWYYGVDLLCGVRYVNLTETLDIVETKQYNNNLSQFPQLAALAGDTLTIGDHFGALNRFYGAQIGVDSAVYLGCLAVEVRGKVAVGANAETVRIDGDQLLVSPTGATSTFKGGLLAQPTNIGSYHKNVVSAIPECDVNMGYRFSENLCIYGGYSILFWNRLVRPGDQIDRVLDTSQIPNYPKEAVPTSFARPAMPFNQTTFWAQGVTVGIEVAW